MTAKMGTKTPRRIPVLEFFFALTVLLVDGIVVPRPVTESAAAKAITRLVELGRNHFEDVGRGSREDDVLHSSPSPRYLFLDATKFSDHSPNHEKLSTSYNGDVPGTSIEFEIENHNGDGKYAIISGLGLNVQIITSTDDNASSGGNSTDIFGEMAPAAVESPCRVKVFTKRGEGLQTAVKNTGTISVDDVRAYELALDARVLCKGRGKETLLPSELFVANYGLMKQNGPVVGAIQMPTGSPDIGGGDGGRRMEENTTSNNVENAAQGEVEGPSYLVENINGTIMIINSTSTTADDAVSSYGLSPEEKDYPLLIPPNESISLYIVVMAVNDTADGASFLLISSSESAEEDEEEDSAIGEPDTYKSDTTFNLYSGLSIINAYIANDSSPTSAGTVDEQKVLVVNPAATIFNGDIYYDTFLPTSMTLVEYYDALEYSFFPGGGVLGKAGCEKSIGTGLIESVGSYGMMFDVSSAVPPNEDDSDGEDAEGSTSRFKNVEIYGMDLYILNLVNASFEVYVRKNTENSRQQYMSYITAEGQTNISASWDMIAIGKVEGKGSNVFSPIPVDAWGKNVVVKPGEAVGFYVTVKGSPDLRYRNSSLPEGNIYKSDGVLNVGVGRSWGEYPLREDGTDVFFSPREFSGAFHYHVQEGLRAFCETTKPTAAPTLSSSDAPTISASPTAAVMHPYAKEAEAAGMCPEESSLETTFQDGTGSYGALFDIFAKTNVMLTGIDFNMDWNTDSIASVLVYARQGSWYGHQNSAESWPHLLVNTTLSRPAVFQNRSTDGPFITIDLKRISAVVPRSAFTPLEMKIGEVWSLYVCTSVPDFRYTLGTKLGEEYASNSELRVMQGAGAADWPPFLSGTPAAKSVEYTFYTPRLFNGNLRYDHIAECPSASPSRMYSASPTPTPILTTSVSYTFYVEHNPEKSWSVNQDMSSGVRAVLDRFLAGENDMLHSYVIKDELVIESVVASGVSPTDIGYLCYPTPPQTCTPITVLVTSSHRSTASTDDVMFELLRQSIQLPSLIDVTGYTIQYVGQRAIETVSEITVSGVPSREMEDTEKKFFENAARDFLQNQANVPGLANQDNLRILSVTVNGQDITKEDDMQASTVMPRLEEGESTPNQGGQYLSHQGGRRLQGSNNVQVSVKGMYKPPPELDFGELVETSINRDRELLQKELNKPPPVGDEEGNETESHYFEKAEVKSARQIKEMQPIIAETDDILKDLLKLAAMGIGGLIGVLSLAFFLRPHRRRAIFSSRSEDMRHLRTQPVNIEDQELLVKSRSDNLTASANSFPSINSEKVAYNDSDRMLQYSEYSPQVFDPRGSGSTGGERLSFTRGPIHLHSSRGTSFNERSSSTRGGPTPPPPGMHRSMSDRQPQFMLQNSIPPTRYHGPSSGNFNSVPPVRRGLPPPGPVNQSMPPFRGGGGEGGGGGGGGHFNQVRESQRGIDISAQDLRRSNNMIPGRHHGYR